MFESVWSNVAEKKEMKSFFFEIGEIKFLFFNASNKKLN